MCYGPDNLGFVTLLLEDGYLLGFRSSVLAELAAAPWTKECWAAWVKIGAAARHTKDSRLGVVCNGPDGDGSVGLLLGGNV